MPLVLAIRAKPTPNLLSLARMRYFGPTPKAVASRSGTRSSGIGRRASDAHMDDSARVQFENEEGKQRTEEHVSYGAKVVSPDLLGMSRNERPPRLSLWSGSTNLPHVLLNGALAD